MNLTITSAPSSAAQKEIVALRRIANYQGDSVTEFGPGMWQSDRYYIVEIDGGKLKGELDFYSQLLPKGERWDVDAWEAEKLRLYLIPCRQNFRALYSMIRSLMGGRTLTFSDSSQLSRQSHLSDVRERGLGYGIDISFEEYSGQVEVRG